MRPRILYFIQLPPPVHGVSIINQIVYSDTRINQGFDKHLLEIKFSNHIYQLRKFSFRKLLKFFRLGISLMDTLIGIRPDLIYFSFMPVGTGLWRDCFFVFLMRLSRAKIIFHLHNKGIAENASRWYYRVLYQWIFKHAAVVHLSESLIREEFGKIKLKNVSFYPIPNTIDICVRPGIARKKTENVQLLFLSNLLKEKGIFDLLQAFEKVCAPDQNISLVVAGAPFGDMDYELRKYISSKEKIRSKIRYAGSVFGSEKQKLFLDSDIFVFPSYFAEECFPLVVLEAMAYGLPVIASNMGAIPDMVTDGRNGFLVESRNINAFADKIQCLIRNQGMRKAMGEQGQNIFYEKFSLARFEDKMSQLFASFLLI